MKKYIKPIVEFIKKLASRCMSDNISLYAAQASFFIIIASIPFVMLLMSLIKYIFPINIEETIELFTSALPTDLKDFVISIIYEIYPKSSSAPIISVTAFTAFWSSSRGMMALKAGISGMSREQKQHNYVYNRLIALIYNAIFIVVIICTLLMFAFGNGLIELSRNYGAHVLEHIFMFIVDNRGVAAFIMLSFYFTLMYTFLPNTKRNFKYNIPGALFSSAGWIIFSYAYGIYIDNFSSYSYLYGSLTAIVLLMLWLYFCMNILLLGAEINTIYHEKKTHTD